MLSAKWNRAATESISTAPGRRIVLSRSGLAEGPAATLCPAARDHENRHDAGGCNKARQAKRAQPAALLEHCQRCRAADEHAERKATNLKAVRPCEFRSAHEFDRPSVGCDVLRRAHHIGDQKKPDDDQDGGVRGRGQGDQRIEQHDNDLRRNNPALTPAEAPSFSPIDQWRPEELQRPWQDDHAHHADGFGRIAEAAQHGRQRHEGEPHRQALRDVQGADRDEGKRRADGARSNHQ
jgi:hypothetical protein